MARPRLSTLVPRLAAASDDEDSNKKKGSNWLLSAAVGFVIVLLCEWLWPDLIPFTTFQFWDTKGSASDWFGSCWPIFAWGGGVTAIAAFTTRNERKVNRDAEHILIGGTIISIWAGVMEEICFRWLIFMSAIVGVTITNFLVFGFLGFGIPEWLFLHLFGPLADFTTLGHLHASFFDGGWAVGAAILAANSQFRDGHKYQGIFGWINSWFMGMVLFWIMFTYGLPVAILMHFLYDLLIFGIRYVDAAIERARGFA